MKVVNPGDVPRIAKQDWQKTDKIDSRHLSKQLQSGNLKGIHIPDEEQEQLRSLFRRRLHLVRQLRSLLIESSWVAVRTDMALQEYNRKHAHKEPNKAIIKVVHKNY